MKALPIFAAYLLLICSDATAAQGGCSAQMDVSAQLKRYMDTFGFERPGRSTVNTSLSWRFGVPNYDSADLLYFKGRTKNHAIGSAEHLVENLVKKWEMEASHLKFQDWSTVSHEKYSISANGAPPVYGQAAADMGNYNALFQGLGDDTLYAPSENTFESSHQLFRGAFTRGFPWELLEVLAGPPKVVFSWRHWATFDGIYRKRKGDGKIYEMFGMGVVSLDESSKITDIEIYYKPKTFLKALQGEVGPEVLRRGADIFGKGVPIAEDMLEISCPLNK